MRGAVLILLDRDTLYTAFSDCEAAPLELSLDNNEPLPLNVA